MSMKDADVIIVGGGIAGLSAAVRLKEHGIKVGHVRSISFSSIRLNEHRIKVEHVRSLSFSSS